MLIGYCSGGSGDLQNNRKGETQRKRGTSLNHKPQTMDICLYAEMRVHYPHDSAPIKPPPAWHTHRCSPPSTPRPDLAGWQKHSLKWQMEWMLTGCVSALACAESSWQMASWRTFGITPQYRPIGNAALVACTKTRETKNRTLHCDQGAKQNTLKR